MPNIPTVSEFIPQPATPENVLALGKIIYFNYIKNALEWPVGTNLQEVAAQRLHNIGFYQVEWAQPSDYTTWLGLWFDADYNSEKWIIEFDGEEDVLISVYKRSAEEEVV